MKKLLLGLCLACLLTATLHAIQLSEFLDSTPVGKFVSDWRASRLVPEHLIGRTFQLPTTPSKTWQIRFYTFEDREKTLQDANRFADFVKKYGLEALESKKDAMPYNDGTLESFTFKDANAYLEAKGKPPLPNGIYFIISFRTI